MPLARHLPLPAALCRPTVTSVTSVTSVTARPRPAVAKPAPGTADA